MPDRGYDARMSEPVKPRRAAIAAGILTAAYVIASFLVREVPDSWVALLGGPDNRVDRIGGLRVQYKSAAGEVQQFDYEGVTEDQVPDVIDALVNGGLQMRVVVESNLFAELGFAEEPRGEHDPGAVVLEFDQWRPEDGGGIHTDTYLRGPSREAIERALVAHPNRIQLPEGTSLVFERTDPWEGARDRHTYWRTYLVSDEVPIDGTMIDNATKSFDPNTNRPTVLLDFTEDGTKKFCNVTLRIVGSKLATILGGRVRSAPIINGAICGGRASITMGGSDPIEQEREADALASVLLNGALPIGGTIVSKELVPAGNAAPFEWGARLFAGLLAGLVIGLVTLLVVGFSRPRWRVTPPAPAGTTFPWRRFAVTLLAPASLFFGGNMMMPGINDIELEHIVQGYAGVQFSVVALGITPLITSFILVELVALAVPRLRWRRHDVVGRIALGKAVAVVALVVALVQAYFVVSYLESLSRSGAEIMLVTGLKARFLIMGSLAAATMLLAVVAGLIREHGLGNGYGALLASATLILVLRPVLDEPADAVMTFGVRHLLALVTAAVIAVATAAVLRWRIAGAEREPDLRLPTTGITPLSGVGGLLVVIMTLSAMGLGLAFYDAYVKVLELHTRLVVGLAILVAAVPLYGWLFSRPSVVERVAMQAGLDRPSRRAWLRGTVVSGALLLGVSLVVHFTIAEDSIERALTEGISIMVCTAVWLDLRADGRAYRQKLVPAGVLHQIQYAGVVERVLADSGVPCHIHASHLRALLAFFGPFAPAIVMVPEEHGPAARTRVDDVLRAATSKPPVALLQEPARRPHGTLRQPSDAEDAPQEEPG